MLCAASIMLGLTSLRLPSTRRATNGNAAMTSGTIDATVPTAVPTIRRVSGNTTIMSIRNGIERSMFTKPSTFMSHVGSGRTPPRSPATRRTPSGRPIIIAKNVERTVTYNVSHIAKGNSLFTIAMPFCTVSDAKNSANISPPPLP